ncbi:MAG TPA: endo-1,3-alpha-glucanase family glycosylhydrolase [Chitinophagaceae bacterium]|jgi:hypothetical protein|nr:endo-1,3-alpha-glucanase family glycosylhydrolase [Chitinophagaceae bacterium]
MQVISYKATISVALAIVLLSFHKTGRISDDLKNLPQLSMALTDKKLVIAHCMPDIIRYKGHKLEDSCNPEFYSPGGTITASLGGLTQVNVIADNYLAEKTLDEAVEFEMRAAIASGIDGFQFYYTLGNDSWDEIIKAYFRVAGKKNIAFKFTFCISHPSGSEEAGRIADFAKRMNSILDEAGRKDPHWLRTPDGRLIVYTWYGDGLADIPGIKNELPPQYHIAKAYKKLAEAVQEEFACIISINEQISKEKLNLYLDYFPAVWLWTLPYNDNFIGNMVAAECKKRKRNFTGSAFPDFYTSKLLKRGTWDMYHFAADAAKAGISNTERKYIVTGLSYNFRKQLEFGIAKDVQLMNIITWNDYPEGHHLAPEVNHNDGFSVLLNYYKAAWKHESSPYAGTDVIIAFYKKYAHGISPSPFNIPVVEIEKPGVPLSLEDSIEVITLLSKKSQVQVNDDQKEVAAGLQSTKFPARAGAVIVTVKRNKAVTGTLRCPEWITDKPYRTDRLTCSYSNQCDSFYRYLFGDHPVISSEEYNPGSGTNKISFYGKIP